MREDSLKKQPRIIGTGTYVPEQILTNRDLEKMVDTSDEWITSRTGMKERRIASAQEHTSFMGYQAALKALEKAHMTPEQIDLIIVATLTPDYIFPSTACLIQSELGAQRAVAFDIQAACTGYLYALGIAKAFIGSGMYKNVLVVASEKLSTIVNYADRNTCVLFGDGASACVVSDQGAGLSIDELSLGADGTQAELLILPAGGSRKPASLETLENAEHFLHMDGKEVFKHAVRRMESAARDCIEKMKLHGDDISWIVPHQANLRIIEAIARRFDVPIERAFLTIHKYGNTSASSIGIALDELCNEKELKQGDHLLLIAFGAGLTWGAGILTACK